MFVKNITQTFMEVNELIQLLDKLMQAKMGKSLNDLQRKVIEGGLNGETYSQIADSYGCTERHASDVGYELLKKLSSVLGEEVDKRSLKSVIDKQKSNLIFFLGQINNNNVDSTIGCINFDSNSQISTANRRAIRKLQEFGLSDDKISEALNIPLEDIQQSNLNE